MQRGMDGTSRAKRGFLDYVVQTHPMKRFAKVTHNHCVQMPCRQQTTRAVGVLELVEQYRKEGSRLLEPLAWESH